MSDKEICPKCHTSQVYSEHYREKWKIRCAHCNYQTTEHNTWRKARAEWDKMKGGKEK